MEKLILCSCGNTVLEGKGCSECWKSVSTYRTDEVCISDKWEKVRGVHKKCKLCWSGIPLPKKGYCSFDCMVVGHASMNRRHYYKKKAVNNLFITSIL